jgi:hypothetical protein
LQALEGQHRRVDLEGSRQLVSLEEHRLVLEGEDHQQECRQGFNHLLDLVVHLEGLPLVFNRLLDFKGRLVKGEDFLLQALVGDDADHIPSRDGKGLENRINAAWVYSGCKADIRELFM